MSENHEFFPEVIFGLYEEHIITCILTTAQGNFTGCHKVRTYISYTAQLVFLV